MSSTCVERLKLSISLKMDGYQLRSIDNHSWRTNVSVTIPCDNQTIRHPGPRNIQSNRRTKNYLIHLPLEVSRDDGTVKLVLAGFLFLVSKLLSQLRINELTKVCPVVWLYLALEAQIPDKLLSTR